MSEPNPLAPQAETTFCLIKPFMVHTNLYPEIIQFLQRNKFMVLSTRNMILTRDIVHEMLKPFFGIMPERVVDSMVGSCVSIELARENAIQALRHVTGHEDPRQAKMGTIRYMWGGMDTAMNCVFIPQNEAEFKHMFGCLDLWSRVFMQALNERIVDPVTWSEQQWQKMFSPASEILEEIAEVKKDLPTGNEFELPSEKSPAERVAEGYEKGGMEV